MGLLCNMNYPSNRLSELKPVFRSQLEKIYATEEAENLINLMIKHHLGLTRVAQALHADVRLSESELLKFHFAMKRLLKSEPIQYVLGVTHFYGLPFEVNPAVLIPRPETEELVDTIIKRGFEKNRILDIGTGSGCIAVALKSKLPDCKIVGLDVSEEALSMAQKNARNNHVDVEFIRADLTEPKQLENLSIFDIIVSNPPYVTHDEKGQMSNNVLEWEPSTALFAPQSDPLFFYRKILEFCKTHLTENGHLFLEINENFGHELIALARGHSFTQVTLHQDFNGRDRFLVAVK
jgi:release factor glutamine methyltransferase